MVKLFQKIRVLINDSLIGGQITACKHVQTNRQLVNKFKKVVGQAVFSPNGEKYVRYNSFDGIDIFNFDRCSDFLILLSTWPHPIVILVWGVSISPSSNYLYASSTIYLYQYDLLAANIDSSRQTVAINERGASQISISANSFAAGVYTYQLIVDEKVVDAKRMTLTK